MLTATKAKGSELKRSLCACGRPADVYGGDGTGREVPMCIGCIEAANVAGGGPVNLSDFVRPARRKVVLGESGAWVEIPMWWRLSEVSA